MRLTSFLWRKIAPGKIWTGKNRLAHKPTEENVRRLQNRFAIEEQNMFYLRHPFLTVEQANGYAKDLGKREAVFAQIKEKRIRPYRPHVRIEDRLTTALAAGHSWD